MEHVANPFSSKMKKPPLAFCALLLLALLFGGASAPYVRKPLKIEADGETVFQGEIRIDAIRSHRAKKHGGYFPFYQYLRARYDEKEALNYLSKGFGDYLAALCEKKRIDPLSATLEWNKDLSVPFLYYAERAGREIALDEIGSAVMKALDQGGTARVFSSAIPPDITVADLKARTREMGRFTTYFASSGENRRHNLRLAAEAISGTIVEAGETFSFNETVGARTKERGFREANIVINGEFVKGVGGGVCQISTTLYNAALLSGLPIERAAAHSAPVSYVPFSRDCTVSSAIDFTFVNDTAYPVYIASKIEGNGVTFSLFGEKKEGTFALQSEVTERIPFFSVTEGASAISEDSVLVSPGREGIKSRLYLLRTIDGKTTKTLIRENYYPPKNAVWTRREESVA